MSSQRVILKSLPLADENTGNVMPAFFDGSFCFSYDNFLVMPPNTGFSILHYSHLLASDVVPALF